MKHKKKERVAVTGARGFLGRYMVSFLKRKGYFVRAITRTKKRFVTDADELVAGDLTNQKETSNLLKHIDYVYHFAADMGGVGYFSQEQYYPYIHNIRMDLNVLEACEVNGIKRLFYPSSACVYPVFLGDHAKRTKPLAEHMIIPADPDQMYGWEKLNMLLLARHTPFQTRVGILHTIFGEHQEWQGPRAKFPGAITYKILESKKRGGPIEIWGDGTQERTFLYITDAIEKIYEVMMSKQYYGEVNISSEEVVTVKRVADWLSEFAEISPVYVFNTTKPSGVKKRGVDTTKFNTHYKYRDKVSTKEGFKRVFTFLSNLPEFRT